jgi:hypothetical protein
MVEAGMEAANIAAEVASVLLQQRKKRKAKASAFGTGVADIVRAIRDAEGG